MFNMANSQYTEEHGARPAPTTRHCRRRAGRPGSQQRERGTPNYHIFPFRLCEYEFLLHLVGCLGVLYQ